MMNGAASYAGSLSRAAKQALLAGNDIIMLSKTPSLYDPVWTYLVNSMKEDSEFKACVRGAARRIIETKLRFLDGAVPYVPDSANIDKELSNPEAAAFFLDLAVRSVTVIKGISPKEGALPLPPEKAGRVLLAGQYGDFFRAGKNAYPQAVSIRYPVSQEELASYGKNADTIIFCLSGEAGLRLLRSLQPLRKKIIVLSVLSPVYLESVPWVDAAVAVYSYAPESFAAGFSVILGRIPAAGKLPYE
jgi:beta-N-acetylhexosaminidase